MNRLTFILLVVVGVLNALPMIGVLSAARLETMYGVAVDNANLELLLRHRAVLFGIVGALLLFAAFHQALRPLAIVAGLVSMASFVVLYALVGASEVGPELRRVAIADVVGTLLLLVAWFASWRASLVG